MHTPEPATCPLCGALADDTCPAIADLTVCPRDATDAHPGPAVGSEGNGAPAPDATAGGAPFPLDMPVSELHRLTPEQRAWLMRVNDEALAKRFAP